MSATGFHVYGRDAKPTPDVLQVDGFPYSTLMGDWMIVGSSLPLWKNRSDVLCRYTPHDIPSRQIQAKFHETTPGIEAGGAKQAKEKAAQAAQTNVSFSDEIWWEQLDKKGSGRHLKGKGAPREKRSIVRGRNKVDPKGTNGATFLWRGYNLLKPFTSHWQILAHSENFIEDDGQRDGQPIWLVTYFTATLFTEAGIDLYVRGTLSDDLYDQIVAELKAFTSTTNERATTELRQLAGKMFKVPVGNA